MGRWPVLWRLQPLLLLVSQLLAPVELGRAQHFGALDLDVAAAGLLPRYYQEAVPAVARRDSGCADGFHSCK